jgi:hypothetical protein
MRSRVLRLLPVLLVMAAWAPLAGCSSFERDWKALGQEAEPAPEPEAGVEGRWDGTWLSDVNGHSGRLRCIVATDEAGTTRARYHATYAGFLTFRYTVPMDVRREGDVWHFSSEADLGWFAGGRYEYEGTIAGDEFRSTYRSAHDHGTFDMRRVR